MRGPPRLGTMIRTFLMGLALASPGAATAKPFDPLAFFTGPSRGEGTLKVALKPRVTIRVESLGRPDGRGGLILTQSIREGDKAPRERRWVLRPTSATSFSGTVTDNPGPVTGRLVGDSLRLSYTMKGGLQAEQTLTPDASGRTVYNRMTVRRLGVVVARVEETIRKLD